MLEHLEAILRIVPGTWGRRKITVAGGDHSDSSRAIVVVVIRVIFLC
jgi:hypothetical protein